MLLSIVLVNCIKSVPELVHASMYFQCTATHCLLRTWTASVIYSESAGYWSLVPCTSPRILEFVIVTHTMYMYTARTAGVWILACATLAAFINKILATTLVSTVNSYTMNAPLCTCKWCLWRRTRAPSACSSTSWAVGVEVHMSGGFLPLPF